MDLYAIFQSPLCVPATKIFSISFERFVRLAAAVELLNTSTDINRNNLHLYKNFYAIIKFWWEITSVVIPVKVKKVSLEPSPSLSLKSNPKPSVALATS